MNLPMVLIAIFNLHIEQITQISWVLEPTLLSLAGFNKTSKKPSFLNFLGSLQKQQTHRAVFAGF